MVELVDDGDQQCSTTSLSRHVKKKIFSREDTPTERRVLAGFLYHAGASFRRIKPFVERSHVAVHDWYHRLAYLFEPDHDRRSAVAVDETTLDIEDEEVYVWATVDVDTFEVLHIEISPGRSSLDALLFLKEMLRYCHGQPVILADRGEWYDWPLDLFTCEPSEKRGEIAHSSKHGLVCLSTEPCCSAIDFPTTAPVNQQNASSQSSLHSTIRFSKVNTPWEKCSSQYTKTCYPD